MGASFLCPLGLFFVGKNMEAQHEYVVYMLVSNHLILIVWFLFLLGIGKGVCSKDLKMLHTLVFQKWLIGLKPWAENCSAMVSVLEVIGMPCRTCWAAITVVLVLVLDFVILLGLSSCWFLRIGVNFVPRSSSSMATIGKAGRKVRTRSFSHCCELVVFFLSLESQFLFMISQVSGPKSMHLIFKIRLWQIIL